MCKKSRDTITQPKKTAVKFAAVRCERARELGGEFQRKFDLVRWGIWYDQTYAYTNNATLKGKMRPCHRYYPIPDAQCALSGYVLTNDEYLADGL